MAPLGRVGHAGMPHCTRSVLLSHHEVNCKVDKTVQQLVLEITLTLDIHSIEHTGHLTT